MSMFVRVLCECVCLFVCTLAHACAYVSECEQVWVREIVCAYGRAFLCACACVRVRQRENSIKPTIMECIALDGQKEACLLTVCIKK